MLAFSTEWLFLMVYLSSYLSFSELLGQVCVPVLQVFCKIGSVSTLGETCFVTLFAQWCVGVHGFTMLICFEAEKFHRTLCALWLSTSCGKMKVAASSSLSLPYLSLSPVSYSICCSNAACSLARLLAAACLFRLKLQKQSKKEKKKNSIGLSAL